MENGIAAFLTEEHLMQLVEQYRSLGPLPGILLTFLKSFVPPLPTIVIVGINAAVYGLWAGFLYSWIGMVCGCMTTFLLVRKAAGHPYWQRWASKPKVSKSLSWVRRNAFSYVFLLSLFPVGPFVMVNIAAAVARMRVVSFLIAVAVGKGVMVFSVSYIGHDLARYKENPAQIAVVLLFIGGSFAVSKAVEARFSRPAASGKEKWVAEAEKQERI